MVYYKYKIFCQTDNKYEYVIKESTEAAPSTCPVNTDHTCYANSAAIEDIIDTTVQSVDVESLPDPAPFAAPAYRTKWDASPDVVTVEASQEEQMDFQMQEERYVHGGSIVYDGVKLGDWLEAQVVDRDEVIPEPYRAALCEDWPIVASYILKHYLASGSGKVDINTYPLNAKITPGLVLRVKMHTTSDSGTRKFATNYLLTKKLV